MWETVTLWLIPAVTNMVLSQTRVTVFLSPVGISPRPHSQSLTCGQRNPAPENGPPAAENGSSMTSPVLPAIEAELRWNMAALPLPVAILRLWLNGGRKTRPRSWVTSFTVPPSWIQYGGTQGDVCRTSRLPWGRPTDVRPTHESS